MSAQSGLSAHIDRDWDAALLDSDTPGKHHQRIDNLDGRTTKRGGPSCLDSMFHSLSGASRWSDYAAVSRGVRLSQYTSSGVLPSSARCGLVWL